MKQRHNLLTKSALIFVVFLTSNLLVGCQQEKGDLQTYINQVKSQKKSDIPPIPVMKPYEKFEYTATKLRDPFIPTVVEMPTVVKKKAEPEFVDNGIKPDRNRRKEILEFYPLDKLRYVGNIEQDSLWALIKSPDGVIHRARLGNYLGEHDGKVTEINESEIKLVEIVPQGQGYVERVTVMSAIEAGN